VGHGRLHAFDDAAVRHNSAVQSEPLLDLFVSACFVLSWAGSKLIEQPYIAVGQSAMVESFLYFFVLVPALGVPLYHLLTRTLESLPALV
jgi:hypothetical protein